MNPAWPRKGLYAITPDEPDTARLLARIEPVLRAGAGWLQYRNKSADAVLRKQQVLALKPLCRQYGVPLIINDDWQLAVALGADGAHLGQGDGDLAAARAALGAHAILGATCQDSLEWAVDAIAQGASYVAFGAFFVSTTKPLARRAPPELLRRAARLGVPVVAIGGITPDNGRVLVESGADLLAVVGGIFDAPDPVAATRAYLSCFTVAGALPE
ncbi:MULTISPECIES: thiamine phosphate synthase [unclassified Lysobacter]